MKIVLPAKLAAVAAAATLASAGLVSVSAARASSPSARHDTMSVSITASPLVSQRTRVANPAAADCKPELQAFNRFQLCYEESIRVRLLRNGHQVGHAIFIVTHSIQLSPRSRDFTEHVIIGRVKKTTNAGGIHVALGLRCHSPCVATENTFPVGKTLRSGLHGDLAYHDAVTAGHVHKDHSDYEWLFVKRGFHPRGITTHTVIDYRCDDAISHRPAGCVFPEFPPVLTSMKNCRRSLPIYVGFRTAGLAITGVLTASTRCITSRMSGSSAASAVRPAAGR